MSESCHPLDRRHRTGSRKEETMAPRITRRNFLVGTAATAAFAGTPAFAQPKPVGTASDEDAARDRGLERMAASLYEVLG